MQTRLFVYFGILLLTSCGDSKENSESAKAATDAPANASIVGERARGRLCEHSQGDWITCEGALAATTSAAGFRTFYLSNIARDYPEEFQIEASKRITGLTGLPKGRADKAALGLTEFMAKRGTGLAGVVVGIGVGGIMVVEEVTGDADVQAIVEDLTQQPHPLVKD